MPRPSTRRLARALRRLAVACGVAGVAVVAGPGCFLFHPCDGSNTHTEARILSEVELAWFSTTPPDGPFTTSWMSGDAVWLAGPAGGAYSKDGGATWTARTDMPEGLAAIDAVDVSEMWMVGAAGLAGVWRDGTFDPGATSTTVDLADVAVYDGHGGVAVGAEGTLLTSDDGATWLANPDVAAIVEGADLAAVDLLSDGTAWVVGEGGLLLHRDADGWEVVDLGTDADLRGVAFASVNRGIVAGAGGAAFVTDDAGATWRDATAPGDLAAVTFTGSEADALRWAAGAAGIVWSFDGDAWREETSTADGAAVTTLASSRGSGIAAGPGALAMVFGLVERTSTERVEVSDCTEFL